MQDAWVSKYEQEVYCRTRLVPDGQTCRPVTAGGILYCTRPVVRNGRCILHAPKLTRDEKAKLTPPELKKEEEFEEQFRTELLSLLNNRAPQARANLNCGSIHFPTMPWNQPPWRDFLGRGSADFSLAVFHDVANFSGICFGARSSFSKTVFLDEVIFSCSAFAGEVHFTETVCERPANFNGVQFDGWANFAGVRFLSKADFTWVKVRGRLWFKGAEDNSVFDGEGDFGRLEIWPGGAVILESLKLARCSFLHTDLLQLTFKNVQWNEPSSGFGSRIRNRRRLWDEARLTRPEKRDVFEAVAENYRQLVLNYEARRDFDAAEDFHIGEMEVQRLRSGCSFTGWMNQAAQWCNATAAYRVLSGYGTSCWQALSVLLLMIALTAGSLMFAGLRRAEPGIGRDVIAYHFPAWKGEPKVGFTTAVADYREALVHTFTVLTFQRERRYSPLGSGAQLIQSLSSLLASGQTALLLFAIRRRFRR